MLKEFLNQHQDIPYHDTLNIQEYLRKTVETFDGLVDFLRDPERFPNRRINETVTLMWRLIGNKDIPVVLDKWGFPSLSFAVVGNKANKMPLFIMPVDFIDQVREDPVMQLGIVTYMSSQARDYYAEAIRHGASDVVNRRARAFEAEALLTLEKMSSEEGMDLYWNELQQSILSEFPYGLASLPSDLDYHTPEYRPQNYRNN